MPLRSQLAQSMFEATRAYPQDVSLRQIKEEIPIGWRQDQGMWGYINKYLLKGSGAGFVTPPYTAIWERLWGAQPIEDLPKYKELYSFTPYVKQAIDVTVNLAVSNGFELQGSTPAVRDYLQDWLDQHNYLETLRIVTADELVFGNGILEICKDGDRIDWLKPLDPVFMRVRRDAYGQVFGYVQMLTMPPVIFPADDIIHFRWSPKSWWYEYSYGTSQLRPLLKIQNLIEQLENDMAVISHLYTKPMLIIQAGTPDKPLNPNQINELIDSFTGRGIASDVFVRGDVSVKPIPSMTRDIKIQWWLDYLLQQRAALLGVPGVFMAQPEGTNKATSQVVMQEYVLRLRMLQESVGDQLESVLFRQLIIPEFGENVEIPKAKWKPVWEPPLELMGPIVDKLATDKIITVQEARLATGFPEQPDLGQTFLQVTPAAGNNLKLPSAPSDPEQGVCAHAGLKAQAVPVTPGLANVLRDLTTQAVAGHITKVVAVNQAQAAIGLEIDRLREEARRRVSLKVGKPVELSPETEKLYHRMLGEYISDFKTILNDAIASKS